MRDIKDAIDQIVEMEPAQFGKDFQEYLTMLHYDTDWEGFNEADQNGLRRILEDFLLSKA